MQTRLTFPASPNQPLLPTRPLRWPSRRQLRARARTGDFAWLPAAQSLLTALSFATAVLALLTLVAN